ncbi:DUF2180 family protein [Streptomyces sp. LaPpAH-108]|uniref:DUF2180 family protein n=1 Tax=Streptomyces sp. LaPpAH-108 TaxID=1155714 RepID=UPI00037B4625|nr:DUF2180 family protein [Streptomyces sp. LaPpAH-108]
MNCFDCQALDTATAAVAICRSCGAGLCDRHAHPHPQALHRAAGMGTATRRHAARRLLCETCAVAERSD